MIENPKAQAQSTSSDGIWGPALKEASVAFITAAVLLVIFYAFTFRWIHPEFVPFMDREATTLIAPGKALIPVSVGAYRVEGSSAIIEDFNGDEAILALARGFQAEDYPFIKVNLQGFTRYSKFKILWRRTGDPSKTHAIEVNRSGDEATQIAMVYGNENYRGRIADIALLFYDGPAIGFENNNEVDIAVEDIEFRPFSALGVMEQVFEDWTNPPLWQGYSNNIVRGVHSRGILSPNLATNLLVFIGIAVATVTRLIEGTKRRQAPKSNLLVVAVSLCVLGWGLNDGLRWHWRIEQLIDSNERYQSLPLEIKIRNSAQRCLRFKADCGAHLLPYF